MIRRALLVTVVALAAASTASATPSRPPLPLHPLSERDQASTREMGCSCTFTAGRSTLVQMIGNEFMIRTRAGRQVCAISDAQFARLSEARGSAACGALTLSLKRTGRVRTHPEADSAEGPASLSVVQGTARRTLAGNWGCAC